MDHVFFDFTKQFARQIRVLSIAAKLIIVVIVVAGLIGHINKSDAVTSTEPYSVLVVAGQSNAQGDNSFAGQMNPPLGSHPADTATKILWSTGDDQFIVNWRNSPTDQLIPLTSVQPDGYFGPEVSLARSLWDQGRRNMVILKVTYGLQRLSVTPNNAFGGLADWNVSSTGESYDNLKLKKSQLASIMQSNNDKYTMDGFYWVQGESDTVKGVSTAGYQTDLENLLTSVKSDLGMHPDAKNILGKISSQFCITNAYNFIYNPEGCGINACLLANYPCSDIATITQGNTNVRQAIQNVADADPATFVVETEDLARGSDFIHLLSASQLTLGSRMANSAFELPYRNEGSDDYDNDGILNAAEDTNGNANLGDDDTDSDGVPNYLDEIIGAGGGNTNGADATKSVNDASTLSNTFTSRNSLLNWKYTFNNDSQTAADVVINDSISQHQTFVAGSLQSPPNYIEQYSTNGGSSFDISEPSSGITNIKSSKTDIPISAKGDASIAPNPSSTFANSMASNEGYVPILVGSRIFTLFHNTYAGVGPTTGRYDIGCVEKSTGTNCTGYPKDFTDGTGNTDFISSLNPIHYLDESTGKLYTTSQRNTGYGITCFDTTTNAMCAGQAYTQLDASGTPLGGTRRSRIYQITKIGSCLYTYDLTLKVYSFDPATGSTPCAGHTTKNLVTAYGGFTTAYNTSQHSDYGSTGPITQSEVIGNKLFITMNYSFESNLDFGGCSTIVEVCRGAKIICFDSTTADGRCSNGAGGYFNNPLTGNCYTDRFCKVQQPFINKTNNTICVFGFKDPTFVVNGIFCHDPLTGSNVTVSAQLGTVQTQGYAMVDSANYIPSYEEAEVTLPNGDSATIFSWVKGYLIASPRSGKAVCFNWTTNSLCSNFGNTGAGSSRWDAWTNGSVSSAQVGTIGDTNDFGYVSDGAGCIWAKGKSGDLWSFDAANGSVPCRRSEASVAVTPSQFYCDSQAGHFSGWNEAKLQLPVGTTLSDLSELKATLKDGSGNVISGYQNINLLTLGTHVTQLGSLDLSYLSAVTYPTARVDIDFKASNGNIFASSSSLPLVALTFNGDDPQICYQTRVEDACNIIAPLTNSGSVAITDENLLTRQVLLSSTTNVLYNDGESCVPDIRVTTTTPPGKKYPGNLVTYNILVENVANTDALSMANNINLTSTIPSGTTYISSSNGTLNASTVSFPSFNLAGSSSMNFTVTVQIDSGSLGNMLNVTNAQLDDDPTAANNSYISVYEVGGLATLRASAWIDVNQDGLLNNSEANMGNVNVELLKGNVSIDTGTTNNDGYFTFSNLSPGADYQVRYTLPTNYLPSPKDVGSNDNIDSDIDTTSYTTVDIAVEEGQNINSTYAGFYIDPLYVPPTTTSSTTTTSTTTSTTTTSTTTTVPTTNSTTTTTAPSTTATTTTTVPTTAPVTPTTLAPQDTQANIISTPTTKAPAAKTKSSVKNSNIASATTDPSTTSTSTTAPVTLKELIEDEEAISEKVVDKNTGKILSVSPVAIDSKDSFFEKVSPLVLSLTVIPILFALSAGTFFLLKRRRINSQ